MRFMFYDEGKIHWTNSFVCRGPMPQIQDSVLVRDLPIRMKGKYRDCVLHVVMLVREIETEEEILVVSVLEKP